MAAVSDIKREDFAEYATECLLEYAAALREHIRDELNALK